MSFLFSHVSRNGSLDNEVCAGSESVCPHRHTAPWRGEEKKSKLNLLCMFIIDKRLWCVEPSRMEKRFRGKRHAFATRSLSITNCFFTSLISFLTSFSTIFPSVALFFCVKPACLTINRQSTFIKHTHNGLLRGRRRKDLNEGGKGERKSIRLW